MVYYGFYFQGLSDIYTLPIIRSKEDVMQAIAECESGNRQFDKDYRLIVHHNANGTYDVGIYQINSTWNDVAYTLGYNTFDREDNIRFANWLYEQQGVSPWLSSYNCWK